MPRVALDATFLCQAIGKETMDAGAGRLLYIPGAPGFA
jgi:hypothetical protein